MQGRSPRHYEFFGHVPGIIPPRHPLRRGSRVRIRAASCRGGSRRPLRPVSYTHLDVYKRQILFCMCFENQSGSVAQILTVAGTKLMQISSR